MLFQITNGTISGLQKVDDSNWDVTISPSSVEAELTISFIHQKRCGQSLALCTSSGHTVDSVLSATVSGSIVISIEDASANENTDSTIDFTVSLSRPSVNVVTVSYATEDGTATAGQDYTSKSGTLTFNANETTKTVSVSLLSDSVNEGNETFKLKLSSPTGNAVLTDSEAIGTIENTDPLPSAWLSRFGRTVGSQAVDAISSRMGAPTGNRVVIGGVEMPMTEERKEANLQNIHQEFESSRSHWDEQGDEKNRTMTLEELALGTSFKLSDEDESTGRTWSAWGQFSRDNFKGKEGELNLEGEVTTGFLGADLASGNWRKGVAISNSKGEGNFNSSSDAEDKGKVESNLTSVYPYVSYESGENSSIFGMLGIGKGDVTLTQQNNQSTKADTSMRMVAVGAKGPLLSQREGDGVDVILQTDGMYLRMSSEATEGMESSEADVTRFRLTLDSSKNFDVGRGKLTPSVQLGVRHDGGDAEEGMGLEVGAGVRYVSDGFTLEAKTRKLLVHEDSNYEERGASLTLRVDPETSSGRGLSLSVSSTWGEPSSSGVNSLWSAEGPHQFGSDGSKAQNRLEAEIGYGVFSPFKKLLGVLTPYFGLSRGDSNRVTRTGTRWKISSNANLELELSRTKGEGSKEDDDKVIIQGGFRW